MQRPLFRIVLLVPSLLYIGIEQVTCNMQETPFNVMKLKKFLFIVSYLK